MHEFLQHVSFYLLSQAILVIMIEKLLIKVPRKAGKLEQFYRTFVEKSLKCESEAIEDAKNSEVFCIYRTENSVIRSLKQSSWIRRRFDDICFFNTLH